LKRVSSKERSVISDGPPNRVGPKPILPPVPYKALPFAVFQTEKMRVTMARRMIPEHIATFVIRSINPSAIQE